MTETPDVSIVVVSYNALEWLTTCLSAVGDAAKESTFEVIVVDNNSAPEVQAFLAEGLHGAEVIQMDRNLGFGRACNLGASRARGRHIMLLNPDAVLHPGAVDALLEFHRADPRRGIVGGRTFRPDGTLDPSSCWGAPNLWSMVCYATGLTKVFRNNAFLDPESMGSWPRDTEREVDIVTGALLLASRETWDELGGFDPDYFMYGEDADLSLRAAELGYHPSITPAAAALHAVGASSPNRIGKQRLLFRGKATIMRKRWSPLRRRAGLTLLASGVALRAFEERALRKPDTTMRMLWAERRDWLAGWPPYVEEKS